MMRLIVHGDISERSLKELAHRIEDDLTALPSVSQVEVSGGAGLRDLHRGTAEPAECPGTHADRRCRRDPPQFARPVRRQHRYPAVPGSSANARAELRPAGLRGDRPSQRPRRYAGAPRRHRRGARRVPGVRPHSPSSEPARRIRRGLPGRWRAGDGRGYDGPRAPGERGDPGPTRRGRHHHVERRIPGLQGTRRSPSKERDSRSVAGVGRPQPVSSGAACPVGCRGPRRFGPGRPRCHDGTRHGDQHHQPLLLCPRHRDHR